MEAFVYPATLIRTVDGDTFDCYIDLGFNCMIKKRVRLMGVDTWESRTRDKEEKVKGLAAKEYTNDYLSSGKITLKSHGVGKFGRVLGEVWVEGQDLSLNESLIMHGHAYVYNGGKKKTFNAK